MGSLEEEVYSGRQQYSASWPQQLQTLLLPVESKLPEIGKG